MGTAGVAPAPLATGQTAEQALKASLAATGVVQLSADGSAAGAAAPSPEAKLKKGKKASSSFTNLFAALKRKGSSSSLAESDQVSAGPAGPGDR